MSYLVTSALVVAADEGGKLHYHYRGARIGYLPQDDRDRLLADGLVAEVDEPAPADPVAPLVIDQGSDTATTGGDQGDGTERPKQAAPKEVWIEYAVTRGMDRDTATEASKLDLIKQYGGT